MIVLRSKNCYGVATVAKTSHVSHFSYGFYHSSSDFSIDFSVDNRERIPPPFDYANAREGYVAALRIECCLACNKELKDLSYLVSSHLEKTQTA